jgi:hypothetical protein
VALDVLGLGVVTAVVETVDELVQEGVRGLAWRVVLLLPDGTRAHGIQRGNARLAFLDPRHRVA